MKVIKNSPFLHPMEQIRVYPLCPEEFTEKQASHSNTTGYSVIISPSRNKVMINGVGGLTVDEVEKWANGLLFLVSEARKIAKEKGLEVE